MKIQGIYYHKKIEKKVNKKNKYLTFLPSSLEIDSLLVPRRTRIKEKRQGNRMFEPHIRKFLPLILLLFLAFSEVSLEAVRVITER